MNKYMKLISIVMMIVIVYTVFFVSGRDMSKNFPQIAIHDKFGDRAQIEGLMMDGNLYTNDLLLDEQFRLDRTGTTYEIDLSFVDRLDGSLSKNRYSELKKEYRSFMRGKESFEPYYEETDEVLTYVTTPATVWDYEPTKFEVSVLHKETETSQTVTVNIPNHQDYWYVDIRDIRYEDGFVYVTTVNSKDSNGDKEVEEVFVHLFDMEKEQLVKSEQVLEIVSESVDDHYEYIDVWKDEHNKDKLYLVQSKIVYSESEYENDVTTLKKVISLDVVTQQTEVLDEEVDKKVTTGYPLQVYDGKLYFIEEDKKNVNLTLYDLVTGKEETNPLLEEGKRSSGDFLTDFIVQVKDDKMYMVPSYMYDEPAMLAVYDLQTLETVYAGEIVIEDDLSKRTNTEVHINDVYFN